MSVSSFCCWVNSKTLGSELAVEKQGTGFVWGRLSGRKTGVNAPGLQEKQTWHNTQAKRTKGSTGVCGPGPWGRQNILCADPGVLRWARLRGLQRQASGTSRLHLEQQWGENVCRNCLFSSILSMAMWVVPLIALWCVALIVSLLLCGE